MTPQEVDPDLPANVQESPAEAWIAVACSRVRALNAAALHALDFLKEVTINFIISTIVWSPVKQWGGNTAPPINRKMD